VFAYKTDWRIFQGYDLSGAVKNRTKRHRKPIAKYQRLLITARRSVITTEPDDSTRHDRFRSVVITFSRHDVSTFKAASLAAPASIRYFQLPPGTENSRTKCP
jgi:hypothetical protein